MATRYAVKVNGDKVAEYQTRLECLFEAYQRGFVLSTPDHPDFISGVTIEPIEDTDT